MVGIPYTAGRVRPSVDVPANAAEAHASDPDLYAVSAVPTMPTMPTRLQV